MPCERRLIALLTLLALAPLLHGCAPMVVAGAAYGGAVLHERRTPEAVLADQTVEIQATSLLLRDAKLRTRARVAVTSYNLNVLLTGQADDRATSRAIADLVARLPKVRRVYNELVIGPRIGVADIGNDAYLSSRAKLALASVDIAGFDPLRVKIVTENAVVYLLGLVTPVEADAAVEKVRRVPGVARVVRIFEYVRPAPVAA